MARLADETTPVHSSSRAEVVALNARRNYVYSVHNKVIGLIDVEGLYVVDTPDALLVGRQGSSQKVKDLVDQLKSAGLPEATEHPFETRPWGRFEILSDEATFKAKKIIVDPGGQLSYQSHRHRAEHWTVISGHAEVVLNGEVLPLGPDQFVYIPAGAKHRVRNPGHEPVVLIEVQTGTYFGEDDITRYSDEYNRA
jgi:mannose-6-phosphate isomerase-like protein (cupin superfamily)